ncbi:MAG: hypothetical protein HQ582_25070 [Planctomycetes bacterium]|nr:hypothetical protein [Planctomycetota bacterium]
MKRLAFYSALAVLLAAALVYILGRNSAAQAAQPSPRVRVYNTGDSAVWPSPSFPLVYKIEVPDVPEGLAGPSPPIPPDAE